MSSSTSRATFKGALAALAVAAAVLAAAPAARAGYTCVDATGPAAPYPMSAGTNLGAAGTLNVSLGKLDGATTDELLPPMMHCEWRVCPAEGEVLAVQAQFVAMGPGAVLELTSDLGNGEAPHHRTLFEASTFSVFNGTIVADLATMALTAPGQTVHMPGCVHLVARTMEVANMNPAATSTRDAASLYTGLTGTTFSTMRQASGFEVLFTSAPGCAPGTIKVGDACQNCPAGQTSVGLDATECVDCSGAGGVFCAGTGLPEQSCPPGTFSPAGAAPAACQACDPSTTSLYGETECRECSNNATCQELDFGGLYKGGFKTTGYTGSFGAATKMSADGLTMVVSGPGYGDSAWIYTRASVGERFERTTMLQTLDTRLDEAFYMMDDSTIASQGAHAGVMSVDISPDGSTVCASVLAFRTGITADMPASPGVLSVFERPGDSWNADLEGSGPNSLGGAYFSPDTHNNGQDYFASAYGWRCRLAGTDRVLVSDPTGNYNGSYDKAGVVWVYSKVGDSWDNTTATTTAVVANKTSDQDRLPSEVLAFGVAFDTDASGDVLDVAYGFSESSADVFKWDGSEYVRQARVFGDTAVVGIPPTPANAGTTMVDGRASGAPTAFAKSGDGEYFFASHVDIAGTQNPNELLVMKRDNASVWVQDGFLNVTGYNWAFITSVSNDGSRVVVHADNSPLTAITDRNARFPFTGYGTKFVFERSDNGTWVQFASVATDDLTRPTADGIAGARLDMQGASADLLTLVVVEQKHATVDGNELLAASSNLQTNHMTFFKSDTYFTGTVTANSADTYTAAAAVTYRPVVYDLCPPGTYCEAGSGIATACEPGLYCAGGSAPVMACAAGKYCPARSASGDTNCTAGYFCPGAAAEVACDSGKYCPEGSDSEADCAAGSFCATPATQVACDAGKYCPARSTSGNTNCTAGSFCATPATQVDCDAGKYCPEGSTAEQNCTAGSFCATPATQVACAAGKYCPAGSTAEQNCTAGSFCATPATQVACAAGKYCPEGSTVEQDCPAGSFCANTTTRANCTTSGAYCPAGSTAEQQCPAGSFCANVTSSEQCPAGSECPAGSTAPSACGLRTFASSAGSASCTECGAEQVPNAASGAIACGECPDGTMANDDFTACEDGSPAAATSASTVAALVLAVVAAVFAA